MNPASRRRHLEVAEAALEERDRLFRQARAARKRELEALYAHPEYGDKLRKFAATLNHFGINDSRNFASYVRAEVKGWLGDAPLAFRHAALSLVGERTQRIRMRAGLAPFDDPLPWEDVAPKTVFLSCKEALGL
jgi:hypothetical protein